MAIRNIKIIVGSNIVDYGILKSYPYPLPGEPTPHYKMPIYTMTISGKDDLGKNQIKHFRIFRFGIHKPKPDSIPKVVGLADHQTHRIKKFKPDYELHSVRGPEYNPSNGAWVVWKTFYIHDGADDPQNQAFGTIGCVEVCDPDGFIKFNDFIISLSGSTKSDRVDKLVEIGASGKIVISYFKASRPPLIPI